MLQILFVYLFPDLIALLKPLFEEFDKALLNAQFLFEAYWMRSEDSLEAHFVNDILNQWYLLLIDLVA